MLGVSSGFQRNSQDAAADDGGGGNRWPREETVALLQIRSEMDAAFRDSSFKGPLWEEVSRKMAEHGFQRSAKKCKEKFENVYKYHKRTKEGRASKSDGKTYRFFDQLQALDNSPPPSIAPRHPQIQSVPPQPMPTTVSMIPPTNSSPNFQPLHPPLPPPPLPAAADSPQIHNFHQTNVLSDSISSSSSTSSDEYIQRRRGKKRKWKDFFHRLMREVIQKQEEMQKKFLETLEKREHDRLAREEAWRVQETSRMNREHEILAQERSMAAAKDAAVIAFLQKVSDQHNLQIPITTAAAAAPPPSPPIAAAPLSALIPIENRPTGPSSSRWPKAEVQALIQLRMNLEQKYQEGVPKGPLWEEISSAMSKMGYNRSAKRCKEKWENINKYFKKVKESNKKRPQDSKTCPYYHLLDAIYKQKAKNSIQPSQLNPTTSPIMALPEQQWPHNNNNDDDDDDDVNEDDDDDSGDEGYEVMTEKAAPPQSPPAVTNAAD